MSKAERGVWEQDVKGDQMNIENGVRGKGGLGAYR